MIHIYTTSNTRNTLLSYAFAFCFFANFRKREIELLNCGQSDLLIDWLVAWLTKLIIIAGAGAPLEKFAKAAIPSNQLGQILSNIMKSVGNV